MTASRIDPGLFRLRAFDSDWVYPLAAELARGDVAASLESLLRVLLVEADQWKVLGKRVGYFADTAGKFQAVLGSLNVREGWLAEQVRSSAVMPPDVDAVAFARYLAEAQDDLSSEKRELLRLIWFADDSDWEASLREARLLLERLANPDDLSLQSLEHASWVLCDVGAWLGGSQQSTGIAFEAETDVRLPADWRMRRFSTLARNSPAASQRLAAFEEARAEVEAATASRLETGPTVTGPSDEEPSARWRSDRPDNMRRRASRSRPSVLIVDQFQLATGLVTEPIGSLPRPMRLLEAYVAYDEGTITHEDLSAEQDAAAEDSIKRMEATGSPIVSDGEQRESSFATYPLMDTLAGTGLSPNLAGDGQFFAIFDDGHYRQLPRLTGGPFRYKTFASEFVEKNKAIASKPVKQAVIAPSMLMLLYPLEGEIDGYPREQFLADVCNEVEKDIRQCFAAGAARVSIDFTEGRLANKNDSRDPSTGKNMLQEFIDLNNRVIDRFSPLERRNIGIHARRGGATDSVHSTEVPYEKLLTEMFQLNAGYFLIQCASEDDKENIYRLCGACSREDANGIPQVCLMGVIDPLTTDVEPPEQVADDLVTAAEHIPVERLGATDDCGFSPFSGDERRKHTSPDLARDIAFQKIAARVLGTRMAADALGVRRTANDEL